MWEQIETEFSRQPSQAEVAKYMLETGIRQDGTKLFFDRVAVSHSQLAAALDKDKRVVTATAKTIRGNKRLYTIFSKLQPTCNLAKMAPDMGWSVIGIEICCPGKPGTIGNLTKTIGDMGISIRQAQCPATDSDLLYIITDDPVNGEVIEKLKTVQNVKTIKLFM